MDVNSRVQFQAQAKSLGRIRHYGDKKGRLLSIVAHDYPYTFLQNLFQYSPNTIPAARVHAILFGRGGVPASEFRLSRQRVSPKTLEEQTEFLNHDDIARESSCGGLLIDGKENALRYWQDSLKNIEQSTFWKTSTVSRGHLFTHTDHRTFT